jgi:hypothetical protein
MHADADYSCTLVKGWTQAAINSTRYIFFQNFYLWRFFFLPN